MSKEVAAAILTPICFDKVPGACSGLEGPRGQTALESGDRIGTVYAARF